MIYLTLRCTLEFIWILSASLIGIIVCCCSTSLILQTTNRDLFYSYRNCKSFYRNEFVFVSWQIIMSNSCEKELNDIFHATVLFWDLLLRLHFISRILRIYRVYSITIFYFLIKSMDKLVFHFRQSLILLVYVLQTLKLIH